MSHDIVIDEPIGSGHDITIWTDELDEGASGVMLDFTLPSVAAGTMLLIAVVRNDTVYCNSEDWTKVVDGVGDGGVFVDVWTLVADGTEGGDVVSFLSLSEQELQGSLVTLRYANPVDTLYASAHGVFLDDTAPPPPSVDIETADDIVLCLWSAEGDINIDVPSGFNAIDVYSSTVVTERTLCVGTRWIHTPGTTTLDSAAADPAATGRAFTFALRYDPPEGGFSHWGPHFPDRAGATIETPAVAAELELGGVTSSGALEFVTLRARTTGTAGNGIEVSLSCDATDPTEVEIDEGGNEVNIHVLDNATTVAELAALINADSSLIEMVGTWNPSDVVETGSDEFMDAELEGGVDASIGQIAVYWGPHFPEGDFGDAPTVPPATPKGVATFALRLEAGTRVTYQWHTDVFKAYDGKEFRAALLDDPRESYEGSALLGGEFALATRGAIAQHAANGAIFSLGLPYEETTVDEVDGVLVYLGTPTADLDWAVVGQRVLIHRGASDDTDVAEGVIQAVDSDFITLDAEPDDEAAVPGATIMPLVPVLLEPEQGFARYRSGCERWNLRARAALFGFPASAVPGELTIEIGTLAGVTFRAATPGISVGLELEVGGAIEIELAMTPGDDGDFNLSVTTPTGCTLNELQVALSGLIWMIGSFDPDAVLNSSDEFSLTPLTGQDDGGPSEMGRGATVTEIFDRPLWDPGLENPGTMTDSVHSLTDIVDLGGVLTGVVEADVPDWGRHIAHTGSLGDDWQWFKAFLDAIKGRWKSFYLPTGRADLEPTDDATSSTLTISGTTGAYDLWAARGYSVLEVKQGDELRYVRVTAAAVDNDDIVLTVEGDALDAAAVDRISWCELVHLESDEVEVTWIDPTTFAVALTARVVQQ